MTLTVIHGDDQIKSRETLKTRINEAKRDGITDIVSLDGKSLTLDTLIQNLESGSFFSGSSRLTVIENLHKTRSKTTLKELVDYLADEPPDSVNAILWEDHELTAAQLKKFAGANIITTKVSPAIFKLTDSLNPNSQPATLIKLLDEACAADSAELTLIMLARQLRLMIQTFDPKAKLPPWQLSRLKAAGKALGVDKLIELHHELAEIDLKNKTGNLPVDLKSELIVWLVHLTTL